MAAISPTIVVLVLLSAASQILGLFIMPATKGLTQPLPTLGFALCFVVGIGLLARISNMGVNLGLLIPIVAALVPLGAVAIGVLFLNEPASFAKIGTLVFACVLIGVANLL